MAERLINYDELPMGSVWDGSPIQRTVNCDNCPFLVIAEKDSTNIEICAWGVAWKVLEKVSKPRKCMKIYRKQPQYNSLVAISHINENRN